MKKWFVVLLVCLALVGGSATMTAAQSGETGSAAEVPPLQVFTSYPSQVIGANESASLTLTLRTGDQPQIVALEVQDVPEGWTASFRGGGHIVNSVYVQPGQDATVDLRLEPPADVQAGPYNFTVIARSSSEEAELPIELIVQERAPARLAFEVELPILRARSDSTFRYNVTLRNAGDEDLLVDLSAQAAPVFDVVFKSGSNEVVTLPVEANSTERLTVEVKALINNIRAGTYPVTIQARSGDVAATTDLAAEIIGLSAITLTTPDGRLSGEAEAGKDTTLTLVVQNTGTAAARNIALSATAPSGWTTSFEPAELPEIAAGEQIEVTAHLQPSDKALSGDYNVTFRARPEEGASASVEYRVTLRTSTMWGLVGVALIAIAIGAVSLAVARFGRR